VSGCKHDPLHARLHEVINSCWQHVSGRHSQGSPALPCPAGPWARTRTHGRMWHCQREWCSTTTTLRSMPQHPACPAPATACAGLPDPCRTPDGWNDACTDKSNAVLLHLLSCVTSRGKRVLGLCRVDGRQQSAARRCTEQHPPAAAPPAAGAANPKPRHACQALPP